MEDRFQRLEEDVRELRSAIASMAETKVSDEISFEAAQQILKEVQETRRVLDAVEEAVKKLKQAGERLGRTRQTS